ncbi:hypothetical protein [Anaplasma phagocytophilum]|uniref:hypothetical protein n=1 Tax=Anaplasma phagocytophilum TaxID=948 RepID=UPI001E51347E|nr:hypothetical protein [Anaplasma phagocytophilum]
MNTWSIDYYMYMMLCNMDIGLAYGVSNDMVATSYGRMGICLVLGVEKSLEKVVPEKWKLYAHRGRHMGFQMIWWQHPMGAWEYVLFWVLQDWLSSLWM